MHGLFQTTRKALLIGACCLALTGCKEVLFSNLEETEANEMVAVLAAAGIYASRERDKDNIYAISVTETDIPVATTLLRNVGYPKQKFQSLGDVFSAEGIVGTPFEEQARYIHAMNQELSKTISSIEGVKSARVFVTAPVKDRYEKAPVPASASVMINFEPGFDAEAYVSKIKVLVAHSLPNLDYDNVAVALFPTSGPTVQAGAPAQMSPRVAQAGMIGNALSGGARQAMYWLPALLGAVCIACAGLLLYSRQRRGGWTAAIGARMSRNAVADDRENG
jgi:type III secretion protein J